MMSISASAVSLNKALLDHNGQVSTFDDLQEAVNASADGDVIYLTLGVFRVSDLNVTKGITIRGTGETSVIKGDVNISIPGTPTLKESLFDVVKIDGNITVSSDVNNLSVTKCWITGTLSINSAVNGGTIEQCQIGNASCVGTIDNLNFLMCYITNLFNISASVKKMTVVNSKIYMVNADNATTNDNTFINCNIYNLNTGSLSLTILNSIIQGFKVYLKANILLNTLITYCSASATVGFYDISTNVLQGCYSYSSYQYLIGETCDCRFSNTELQTNGYLGTDGTIVGIYGGSTPFPETGLSFTPSAPKVTSSKLNLDAEKKELNVNLTVSPE